MFVFEFLATEVGKISQARVLVIAESETRAREFAESVLYTEKFPCESLEIEYSLPIKEGPIGYFEKQNVSLHLYVQ